MSEVTSDELLMDRWKAGGRPKHTGYVVVSITNKLDGRHAVTIARYAVSPTVQEQRWMFQDSHFVESLWTLDAWQELPKHIKETR